MTLPLGPDYDVQCAIVTALTASADVKSLIGNAARIYQDVPKDAAFPYIVIGEGHVADASVENFSAVDVFTTLHIWSRLGTFTEAKKIAAAVKAALHEQALVLSESRLCSIRFSDAQNLRDPNGTDKHIVITFKAHVTPKPS